MASAKLLREAWRRYLYRTHKLPCVALACFSCTDICLCPVPSEDKDFELPDDIFNYLFYEEEMSGPDINLAVEQYAYEVWQGWRPARWDQEEG